MTVTSSFTPKPHLAEVLVGAVILYFSGIYLTVVTYSPSSSPNLYACSSIPCWTDVALGLGGLAFLLLGLKGLWKDLIRSGLIRLRKPETAPEIGSGPEDQKILAIGKEAFGQIRQRRRRPIEALYWSENSAWYWCHPTGRAVKPPGRTLAASLRGKLTPEDWKTLFAYYSLQSRPSVRIAIGFFLFLAGPLFIFGVAAVATRDAYGPFAEALYTGVVRSPIAVLVLIEVFHQGKIMFLKQDRWIAKTIGKESLATAFQKIDQLGLPDVENGKRRKGWLAWIWPMPNMKERIDNLASVA